MVITVILQYGFTVTALNASLISVLVQSSVNIDTFDAVLTKVVSDN